MSDSCDLCTYSKVSDHVAWRGEHWIGVFDPHPASPGHVLLIPQRHVERFDELVDEEKAELTTAIAGSAAALEDADLKAIYQKMVDSPATERSGWFAERMLASEYLNESPAGFNYGINDGPAAGQTVPHVHWHVIPRHYGDMPDASGGIRRIFPDVGDYRV